MTEPRIRLFSQDDMPAAQREVFNRIVNGPRGTLVGPLRAALHNPELADRWQALGQVLRYQTGLPMHLKELAILVTGRHWNSELEWTVHANEARLAGLDPAIIEAIRTLDVPEFADEDARMTYEYCRELLETGQVSGEIHRAVTVAWGETGVVELTALVGYYSMVAMTLNAHHIPLPSSMQPELCSTTSGRATLATARKPV